MNRKEIIEHLEQALNKYIPVTKDEVGLVHCYSV